jgi:beta-lactam-binding protein with PASTA domain
VSVAYQHVREDPRLPSSINPAIPPELDAIVMKAMAKNPANRYQSAADMRSDLLRAVAGQRVEATPVMGDAEKTAIIGAPPGGYGSYDDDRWDEDDELAERRRRRRIIAIVAVVALLLLAGAIALALALSGGEDPKPTTAQVPVPQVVGVQQASAEKLLTDAKLEVGEITPRPTTNDAQVGVVLESTPGPGAEVDEGSAVDLVVGAAPDTIAVPAVVGLSEEDARDALDRAGFTGSINTEQADSTDPEGTVVGVEPERGASVPPNTTITLQVSDGTVEIPNVRGQTQEEAIATLRDAGLTNINPTSVERSDVEEGIAIGTEPAAGSQAGADDEITLLVALPVPTEPSTSESPPPPSASPTPTASPTT